MFICMVHYILLLHLLEVWIKATVAQFKAQYEAALKQVKDADALDKYNGAPLVQRSGININNFDNVK